jgi:hypothetical protein
MALGAGGVTSTTHPKAFVVMAISSFSGRAARGTSARQP